MKETEYGSFSQDGREFVLKQPLLDRPWMNVLSNGNWCYVASHLGGGYSFLRNPTVGRITRWHIDGVPRDSTGKLVYLRDEESGNWWCANGFPPTRPLDHWRCHIGLGYNRIVSEHHGIASELTYFCPMPPAESSSGDDIGDPCLIWRVTLKNCSKRKRKISATNYAELALGNWFEDTSWREFYLLFNRQEFKDEVLYTRSTQWVKYTGGWQAANADANNIPFDYAVFLASSAPVTGYEGDRYEFVGSYRDLTNPQAMDTGKLRDQAVIGRDACSVLQHCFELAAGESVEYVLVLGAILNEVEDARNLVEAYSDPYMAQYVFENNQHYWNRVVATPHVQTPDPDLDNLVNYWFKYQGANLSWWNRNTGYCYFGIYNFGVRDACQDAVSRLPQDPKWVRDHIVRRIFIWQFPEGDWAHGGNFLSMEGTRTRHSDDPINPAFILSAYVRETGDYSVLEEVTPYLQTDSQENDSVYGHVIRGLEFFWSQFSQRGLPLILKADWNDALDQMGNRGKGESVMLACWAIYCIEQFYTCMDYMGDARRLTEYRQRVEKLRETVNEIGWDGNWYWRATHDTGWKLGTEVNKYGKIWSNVNSFAVVSSTASNERRESIYRAFDYYLDSEFGSYTFFPPFAEPEPRAGIISRFAPGTKENGSIFGHSSQWRIWAECFGGRGDKAYEILHKMLPTTCHERDPELYRIEPYVACQYIYGPESDRPGEGSHSWATGTACWTLLNVWEHFFGVSPGIGGLRIDPCLPAEWNEVLMTRDWRGATYDIVISKRKGICTGKVSVELDGVQLSENIIPPSGDGQRHQVKVIVS